MHTALAERAYRTNSVMRPTLGAALSVAPRPFVSPSAPCLRFSRNWKAVDISNLAETQRGQGRPN